MLNELIERFPLFPKQEIEEAIKTIISTYENGGTLFICGNGGSCADSDHISGELLKGFLKKRPLDNEFRKKLKKYGMSEEKIEKMQQGLPAIPLTAFTSLMTAAENDNHPDLVFAQSLTGLAKKGDSIICISTSGNSENVLAAAVTAKAMGLKVIAMTGKSGGKLKGTADILISVPYSETYRVQECHLPIYHCMCADVEEHFFPA